MFVIDDIKYYSSTPKDEKQLKEITKKYSTDIFGENSIYLELTHNFSSGLNAECLPDAYVFDLGEPAWCVVAFELSNPEFHKNVTAKLNRFYMSAKKASVQQELSEALLEIIKNDDTLRNFVSSKLGDENISRFFFDVIRKPPQIVIITDEFGERVIGEYKNLKTEPSVLKCKVYVPETSKGSTAYLFEPFLFERLPWRVRERSATAKTLRPGEIMSISEYELPILESIIELGGSAKARDVMSRVHNKLLSRMTERDHEQLPAGGTRWEKLVQWGRFILKKKGLIEKSSPHGTWKITDSGKQFYESALQKKQQ